MNTDTTLYFANIMSEPYAPVDYWQNVYDESGAGGKFFINLSRRLSPCRFVSRDSSVWSLPWKQEIIPGFEMIPFDPMFNKSFEQVTDERALEIKSRIQQGQKFAVFYSGGMDSTCIIVSLLKNLTAEELESVAINTSIHAIIENPEFWEKYLAGRFKTFESSVTQYDDLIEAGYHPITGDEGDCIFGTSIGLQLYHNYGAYLYKLSTASQSNLNGLRYNISDPNVHYTRYKDLLIRYFALDETPEGLDFGRLLYEKYHHNIVTSNIEVVSLHDFFWWLIFNVKYLNCSVRGAIYFNDRLSIRQCIDSTVNWYNGTDYQLWSMANNNNGQKIRSTVATYKYAQRKYIYEFDNNEWYFYFKAKLESLGNLYTISKNTFVNLGVDTNYQRLTIFDSDAREFFKDKLINYQIDWA